MRTNKILLPVLATMLLAGGSILATDGVAAEKGKNPEGAPCPAMKGCPEMKGCPGAAEMKLTPEQREKIQQLYKESDASVQPLRDQLYVKKQELKALQKATNPDVNAVSKKSEEVVKLKNQIREERRALGEKLDKELGLKPGTHSFMGDGPRRGPAGGCN